MSERSGCMLFRKLYCFSISINVSSLTLRPEALTSKPCTVLSLQSFIERCHYFLQGWKGIDLYFLLTIGRLGTLYRKDDGIKEVCGHVLLFFGSQVGGTNRLSF